MWITDPALIEDFSFHREQEPFLQSFRKNNLAENGISVKDSFHWENFNEGFDLGHLKYITWETILDFAEDSGLYRTEGKNLFCETRPIKYDLESALISKLVSIRYS